MIFALSNPSNPSSEIPVLPQGFEGTRMKWPPELRSKPRDEVFQNAPIFHLGFSYSERQLVKILNRSKWEHEVARVEDSVRSQGRLVIGVDASSLFDRQEHAISVPLRESFRDLNSRLRDVRISSFTLRHSFQVFLQFFSHSARRDLTWSSEGNR